MSGCYSISNIVPWTPSHCLRTIVTSQSLQYDFYSTKMRPEISNRPIIDRLFGADNRPADNPPKHYRCTSTRNVTTSGRPVAACHQTPQLPRPVIHFYANTNGLQCVHHRCSIFGFGGRNTPFDFLPSFFQSRQLLTRSARLACHSHNQNENIIYRVAHICFTYQVRQNKVAPASFSLFSQQPFGILISNFPHLFSEMFYI